MSECPLLSLAQEVVKGCSYRFLADFTIWELGSYEQSAVVLWHVPALW